MFDEVGGPLAVRDVADPVCPDDGVVLRVGATGVCRSDWHAWQGHEDVALPHVPGHELAGVVAAVGPLVTRWAVGQRVTLPVRLRVRTVLVVRRRRAAGLPGPDPAGVHRLGLVRRAGGRARRRPQPGGAARRSRRRGRRVAGLPVRHRVPGGGRPRAARRGPVAGGARVRRRGAVGGDDRRRPRGAGGGRRRVGVRAGAGVGAGRGVRPPGLGLLVRPTRPVLRCAISPPVVRTCRSTRSARRATARASVLSLRRRGRHVQVGLLHGCRRRRRRCRWTG